MKIATIKTGLASLAMLPGLVMAAPAVADKADNAFMMICTALVLFMTIPGIALFYGGLIRGKNVLSMLTQVTVTFALVCILWWFTVTRWRLVRATTSSATLTG
ncbi:ammonia channel precursor (ammonia transporter) [Escherichia coli]|nr:ammonia channel precursor (ammonia transporter) [Escherichia coli]